MAVFSFLPGLDVEIYADHYEELNQLFQSSKYHNEASKVIVFDPSNPNDEPSPNGSAAKVPLLEAA